MAQSTKFPPFNLPQTRLLSDTAHELATQAGIVTDGWHWINSTHAQGRFYEDHWQHSNGNVLTLQSLNDGRWILKLNNICLASASSAHPNAVQRGRMDGYCCFLRNTADEARTLANDFSSPFAGSVAQLPNGYGIALEPELIGDPIFNNQWLFENLDSLT